MYITLSNKNLKVHYIEHEHLQNRIYILRIETVCEMVGCTYKYNN